MADDADRAQILEEAEREHGIKVSSKGLAKGEPGYCRLCGELSPRLIVGACAPCREQADKDKQLRLSRRVVED